MAEKTQENQLKTQQNHSKNETKTIKNLPTVTTSNTKNIQISFKQLEQQIQQLNIKASSNNRSRLPSNIITPRNID